jgi:hypothetical protein
MVGKEIGEYEALFFLSILFFITLFLIQFFFFLSPFFFALVLSLPSVPTRALSLSSSHFPPFLYLSVFLSLDEHCPLYPLIE